MANLPIGPTASVLAAGVAAGIVRRLTQGHALANADRHAPRRGRCSFERYREAVLSQLHTISVTVNGVPHQRQVEPRLLLSDFLRSALGLTGTHVGCEHGVCGACTVLLNGEAVRSCLIFAIQADGEQITTVEALSPGDGGQLHPLQAAFREAHGVQCGFCTPGILMTLVPFLRDHPHPGDAEIREALSGNLCRCTGYQNIVEAVKLACGTAPDR